MVEYLTVDIEPTNRCNASCHFCPRDQTPHQGLMSPEVFDQALARAVEYRDHVRDHLDKTGVLVSICGLGEPLLNKHTTDFVRKVRETGLHTALSTNGALLDEETAQELLDADLRQIYINVGERDEEYEAIYKLPFERTRDNVNRFIEMAGDRCRVRIVLVDHRRDPEHVASMKAYWEAAGVDQFAIYDIINRGGSLNVDHMQFETYEELTMAKAMLAAKGLEPACVVPFTFNFIGFDGQYYLCCSDWKKEVPLGSVFDTSLLSITASKLATVQRREPICKTCNHDPLNHLTEELRAVSTGDATDAELDAVMASLEAGDASMSTMLGAFERAGLTTRADTPVGIVGRRIPVEST